MLAIPAALVGALPLAAAVVYVAAAMNWGAGAPWQLVVLVAGGGMGIVSAGALAVALAAVAAVVKAALTRPGEAVGAAPQGTPRGRP